MNFSTVDNPLAQALLLPLRDRNTGPKDFREACRAITPLLLAAACATFDSDTVSAATPIGEATGQWLSRPTVLVPILRAGLGMLDAALQTLPYSSVGFVGLERDEKTAEASMYWQKLPPLHGAETLVLDPMLATGGSACAALDALTAAGADRLTLVSIVAAPEGVNRVNSDHPSVRIFTAALDRGLDARKYIVPGVGDFGDRLFGT